MKEINFEGIGEVVVTIGASNLADPKKVVRMNDSDWVIPCMDGQNFVGVLLNKHGNYGSLQIKGFATLSYTGTMKAGWNNLVANSFGGVRQDDAGARYLVVRVDETASTAVVWL